MKSTVTALLALCALALPAAAQDYPSRPITLIVPYSAGGGNDAMARVAADKMSKTLGQNIVIENRGGAGGTIATRQIAKAGVAQGGAHPLLRLLHRLVRQTDDGEARQLRLRDIHLHLDQFPV